MGTVDPWSRRRVHRPGKGRVFNPKAPGMSDLNGRSHGEYYEDGKVFKGELWGTGKKIIKFAAKRLDGWNLIKNAGKKLGKNSIGQDGDNGSRASEQHSSAEMQEDNSGNGGKDAGKGRGKDDQKDGKTRKNSSVKKQEENSGNGVEGAGKSRGRDDQKDGKTRQNSPAEKQENNSGNGGKDAGKGRGKDDQKDGKTWKNSSVKKQEENSGNGVEGAGKGRGRDDQKDGKTRQNFPAEKPQENSGNGVEGAGKSRGRDDQKDGKTQQNFLAEKQEEDSGNWGEGAGKSRGRDDQKDGKTRQNSPAEKQEENSGNGVEDAGKSRGRDDQKDGKTRQNSSVKKQGKNSGNGAIDAGKYGARGDQKYTPDQKQKENRRRSECFFSDNLKKLQFAIASAVIRYLKNKRACSSGGGFSGDDLKELLFAVAVALAVVITELLLAYLKNKRAEPGTGNSPDPAKISITVNQPVGSINMESPDCAPISITVYQQVGMKEQFFDSVNGPITDNPQSGGVKKEEPSVLGKLSTTGDQHSVVMNKELPELNIPISSESENNEEDVSKVTMFQVGKSSLDEIERAGFSGGVPDDSPTSGNIEQAGTEEGGCSYGLADARFFVACACFALYMVIRA